MLLTELLRRQGHEVVSARTVAECLDLVASERFDLYMLDDDYIDGTGLELCRSLRRVTPLTPILFFSARALQRDRERAAAAGANAYLTKPDDIFEVVSTVNSILAPTHAPRLTADGEKP